MADKQNSTDKNEARAAEIQQSIKNTAPPASALPPPPALPPEKPKKKRNTKRLVLIIGAVLVIGLIGFNIISGMLQGPPTTYVDVQPVVRGDISQTLSLTGTFATGEKITVFCPVSAPISQVNAELGRFVAQGEQLFSFDTTELERSYRTASANRALTSLQGQSAIEASNKSRQEAADWNASVENIKHQLEIARQRLAEAQAAYNAKQAELAPQLEPLRQELAGLQALPNPDDTQKARIVDLMKQISDLEAPLKPLADAVSACAEDVAYHETLLAQLEGKEAAAEAGVMDENGRAQIGAQSVSPQVAYEAAAEALAWGESGVQAPISGVITNLTGEAGAMASQYSALCTIESLSKVNVLISLSRYDLERVKEGQRAVVSSMGQEYEATITKINAMATTGSDATGSSTAAFVAATVTLTNPDGNIRLGVEANVDITTGQASDVLIVPISAVNTDVDGTFCFVMEGGVARRRTIEIGLSSDTGVEVVSGLSEGDQIVLMSQNLYEGAAVTDDPAAAPADAGGMGMMIG